MEAGVSVSTIQRYLTAYIWDLEIHAFGTWVTGEASAA